jgi:uridylate kinase
MYSRSCIFLQGVDIETEPPALARRESMGYSLAMKARVTVISLGGSLIAPGHGKVPFDGAGAASPTSGVDSGFLKGFARLAEEHIAADPGRKLIVVCGGGSPARDYQAALREVVPGATGDDLDWVGIAATRLNAELLRRILGRWCGEEVVTDPEAVTVFAGRIMVAAGWKPGFSTDNDAVLLALRFSSDTVVNLSNIARVYTDDPRTNPAARPLDAASWAELLAIVGDSWTPGRNTPFDPVAARAAAEAHLRVVFADGRDLANLRSILEDGPFTGTAIGPD